MKSIIFLTENHLIFINAALIKRDTPGEDIGVKEPALLNSAVNRPKQSAFGSDAYPSIYDKAAALYQSVVQNHPFFNANKRTGFVSLVIFLKNNGIEFKANTKEVVEFTIQIADQQNKISLEDISSWIKSHSTSPDGKNKFDM